MDIFKKKPKKAIEIRDKVKKDVEKYYKTRSKNWRDEEELYFGQCWENSNGYRPYENSVFDIIETAVPILTDNFPAPSVAVVDPSKIDAAKNLERAIQWVNEDQCLPLKLPDVVRKSLLTGNGYKHVYYDHDAKGGEGREIYEILHFSQVKLSGRADSIEDCDKACISLDRSRDWLKVKYPKFEKELDKAKAPDNMDDDDTNRGRETSDYGSSYAQRTVPTKYQDDDTLVLMLTYIKDFSTEKIPEQDSLKELEKESEAIADGIAPDLNKWQDHAYHIEGHTAILGELLANIGSQEGASFEEVHQLVSQLAEENPEAAPQFDAELLKIKTLMDHIEEHSMYEELNPEGKRLKYAGGYRVIETVNDIELYDGPNKNWHEEIPLVIFNCYRNGTIYSDGMIRNIADSQRMQAVMGYKEYKGLQKVANPEKEINLESGLTHDDITNEDGAVYEVKSGTNWTVRNLPAGQVSEQGVRFQGSRVEKMRQISGMTDPTRGELPDGRLSEVTVTKTQNQALGRLRLKDRQIGVALRRLSKLVASDIIQHWTTEKVLELENEGGEMTEVIFNPLDVQDLDYEIKSTRESMAGVDKDAFNAFATSLLNTQQITFAQYSELVDMPKSEKLKEFAQENDQVEAERQEVQAQMEQINEQLQAVQIENLKLKAEINMELLSPEEIKMLGEVEREEMTAQLTEVNPDQSENI